MLDGDHGRPRSRDRAAIGERPPRIAVVIPCHRVAGRILPVLERIPAMVCRIVLVDDACPEHTGDLVAGSSRDPRLVIERHAVNLGVGGAVVTGYLPGAQRRRRHPGEGRRRRPDGPPAQSPELVRAISSLDRPTMSKATASAAWRPSAACRSAGAWATPRSASSANARPGTGTCSIRPTASPPSAAPRSRRWRWTG